MYDFLLVINSNLDPMSHCYVWSDLDLQRSYLGSYKLGSRAPGLTILHVMLDNVQLVHGPVLITIHLKYFCPLVVLHCIAHSS